MITPVTSMNFRPKPKTITKQQQPLLAQKKDTVHFSGYEFLGDTNAEKEAKEAKEAWEAVRHDSKTSDSEKRRLKAEYEEAGKLADKAKALKKSVEWAGTIGGTALGTKIGTVIGAGAGAGVGSVAGPSGTAIVGTAGAVKGGAIGGTIGGTVGNALTAPAAHYTAEAQHAIQSKEFKKGYKETRESGELCIIL